MKQPALGKKIIELRLAQGLTQEELVGKCNISVRTIQRIESGEVTPRSYTIKTLFSALDYDHSQVTDSDLEPGDANWKSARNHLQLAMIAGVIYFVVGFPEGFIDYLRVFDHVEGQEFTDPLFYSIIKLLSVTSLVTFLWGFWTIGKLYELTLLKYGALSFAIVAFLAAVVDVATLLHSPWDSAGVFFLEVIILSIAYVFFGAALAMSRSKIGDIALVGGILEIIVGTCFIVFFLAIVGYLMLIPTIIVEIIILYQVRKRLVPAQ